MKNYVCIDVGGTAIKYGIIKEDLNFIKTYEIDTEAQKGGQNILDKIINIVENFKNECHQKEYNKALKLSRQEKTINNSTINALYMKRNKTQSDITSYSYKKNDIEKNKIQKINQSFMVTGMKLPKIIKKMKKTSSMKEYI